RVGIRLVHPDDRFGIGHRDGPQHDGVEHGVHGGRGAGPERQRQDRRQRESGRSAELPDGEDRIRPELVDPLTPAHPTLLPPPPPPPPPPPSPPPPPPPPHPPPLLRHDRPERSSAGGAAAYIPSIRSRKCSSMTFRRGFKVGVISPASAVNSRSRRQNLRTC